MSDSRLPDGYVETDIAVVGMAGRFPGADSVDALWENLRDGVDASVRLTEEELLESGEDPDLIADPNYVPVSYPVVGMEGFDAGFFGFSPREAEIMDPQQRHFLEVAWTALEHAGRDPARIGRSTGIFAGCGASLYLMRNLLTRPELERDVGFFLLRHTGNDKDFLATRASYLMNLGGPSVNVQTACSTSLVAVHLAVQSLLMNECDFALAGGSTFRQPHSRGYMYEEGEIVSPDGRCRTFDAEAEGTIFGSGVGAVVLRRLEDAIADGDTIHAVIKGTAINNDGSEKVGYLAPSVDAQARNMAEALAVSGVDPARIGFVECHGTATPVGDPIEVLALTQAFSASSVPQGSIAIGSVKTNLGHLDTAAGVTGLIKVVLALKHGEIPPSLHYENPNPAIDFEASPFYVGAELQSWPDRGPHRYAAIGALGAGGTNAHAVLQSPPASAPAPAAGRPWQLLPMSARTSSALDQQGRRLAAHLTKTDQSLSDVAFTLQTGRRSFSERRFAVATTADDFIDLIEEGDPKKLPTGSVPGVDPSVVFMFAGGGAQYPGMGQDLYEGEAAYRKAVDECVRLLQPQLDWSLTGLLFPNEDDHEAAELEMRRPSRSLPCLFVTQYAMARLLESLGVEAEAMIGHSMGEYTAAHLAGVFSLADALALVTVRGKLFETVPPGGMLSVPLDASELVGRMPADLSIAAANAPGLCVASGPVDALDALESQLLADDIECSRIHIDIAAHSSMLESILEDFRAFCRGVSYAAPSRPFISNLSGTWITPEEATSPDYWVDHLRHTVRFADGVETLLEKRGRVLLEVGPGRVLTTLAGLHPAHTESEPTAVTMRHPMEKVDDVSVVLGTIGRLWLAGVEVDWEKVNGGPRRRVSLPTYPFEHTDYFIEPGEPGEVPPSLARRADIGSWFWRTTWQRATPVGLAEDGLSEAHCLVFHNGDDFGSALERRLRSTGATVSVVEPGPSFSALGEGRFQLSPGSADDYGTLIESVYGSESAPTHVLHAWCAKEAEVDDDRAFYSLLHLTQALGNEGVDDEIRLDVVTRAGRYLPGDRELQPAGALVTGPVRVTPKEFPNIHARSIDFGRLDGPFRDRAIDQLVTELHLDDETEIVAWRGSDRFVESLEAAPLPPAEEDAFRTEADGVWLITGGLGGLGMLVAREVAAAGKARLILVSRSGVRTPAVDELEGLGAETLVLKADVSDAESIEAAVRQGTDHFGPIQYVVHAAGVVEDALILMKERDSAGRVFAPKVQGTRNLHDALDHGAVERVIHFSSRGALAGVAGQVDYTSASAYLDAVAIKASQIDALPVVSVNWSAWQGVGIAASGAAVGTPAEHPLLDRRLPDGDGSVVFQTRMSDSTHWLLDEHRLRTGEALIPGTGYLEIISGAVREGRGVDRLELQDVFFFSPFMVPEGESRDMRVTVTGSGSEVEVVVEGRPGEGDSWEEHVRGSVALADEPPPSMDPAAVRSRCAARTVSFEGEEQRNANLTLGHRWSNLDRIDFGDGEALAALRLPDDVAGEISDFRLHPALLDVACACAQELVPGFDTETQFFIPVGYGRVTVFDTLPSECLSHIRLNPGAGPESDTATYDITITTPDGRVVVDIADFTMMRVGDSEGVGASRAGASSAPVALQFEGAIEPAEGMDALRRVLVSGVQGQVIVSPQHLGAYLKALREPELPEAAVPASAPLVTFLDTSELEEHLVEHEAIEDVVVLAHEADGEIKSTAFIVWEIGEEVTIAELRRALEGRVEERLIPAQMIEMEAFPLLPDGSVDRHALPDPFAPKDDHVPPSSPTEVAIATIWIELLGVGRVSVHDNFLDVGGHSLLAMRAISKMAKALGVRLSPSVMTLNTLGQIAAEADAASGAAA